jgi:sugar transferase (PEP-CTERM/EpsH1 system associated)
VRVLVAAHRVPWPPDKGDRLRSHAIVRRLARRHDVFLAAFADGADGDEARAAEEALRPLCAGLRVFPRPGLVRGIRAAWSGRSVSEEVFSDPALDEWLDETSERVGFDAALAYSGQAAPSVLRLRARRRVVDLVDVDSAKWAARFAATRNPVYGLEARRVRALEERCLREADAVVVVSEREADLLDGVPGRVHVVPMGVDLAEFACRPPREPGAAGERIGFVGAMDYAPNAEGALWFAREVLPIVRAARPGATLVAIGRSPPDALRRTEGVEVVGRVDDVAPHLRACDVAVVPVRTSHGVQTKAVVAMALGVPQVVADAVVGGLGVVPGIHVLAATEPPEFAGAVLRLLDNPADRARLAAAARRFAEERFDAERNLAALEALLEPRGGGRRPGEESS